MEFRQFRDTYLLVSESGDFMNALTGHVLATYKNNKGYRQICIGKSDWYLASRIIAECFIPNPENLPQIDHIDRNPDNNHVSNLRWVSGQINLENRSNYQNSPFGVKYVHKYRGRYRVRKTHIPGYKTRYFNTLEEATAFLAQETVA
jgi:hypothetical protein